MEKSNAGGYSAPRQVAREDLLQNARSKSGFSVCHRRDEMRDLEPEASRLVLAMDNGRVVGAPRLFALREGALDKAGR